MKDVRVHAEGRLVMPEDHAKPVGPDNRRIDAVQAHERRAWASRFRVSEGRLLHAIQKVGPLARDVERELARTDGPGSQR